MKNGGFSTTSWPTYIHPFGEDASGGAAYHQYEICMVDACMDVVGCTDGCRSHETGVSFIHNACVDAQSLLLSCHMLAVSHLFPFVCCRMEYVSDR